MLNSFPVEDARAETALKRKRDDLAFARKRGTSPAVLKVFEDQVAAAVDAIEKARAAAEVFAEEDAHYTAATAAHQAARAALNTSAAVDRKTVERLLADFEFAKQVEFARGRRRESARALALSCYASAGKENRDRIEAARYAEAVCTAVLTEGAMPALETRPAVLQYMPMAFDLARADYEVRCKKDRGPSWPAMPGVHAFDNAVKEFWSEIARLKDRAARQAAELGAVAAE